MSAPEPDLLATCKELRDACAAAMRVIMRCDAIAEFEIELRAEGIANGFGARAATAIAKAEGRADGARMARRDAGCRS